MALSLQSVSMSRQVFPLLLISMINVLPASAQQPFVEGAIIYKVRLETPEHKSFNGTYTFTFKEGQLKKELKLNNGYQDVLLINCVKNSVYSLKIRNGKKLAIQLNMDDLVQRQKKYAGFSLAPEQPDKKTIAGYAVNKGEITFPDGGKSGIYYSSDWYPDRAITFERFPDAHFLPLSFQYVDETGITAHLEAERVSIAPVENAVFRLPADYKIITNDEYKLLRE